jgi:hypothetical protein
MQELISLCICLKIWLTGLFLVSYFAMKILTAKSVDITEATLIMWQKYCEGKQCQKQN